MTEPAIGERVFVRPQANLRVQEHAHIPGRIMPDAWTERVWDDWLHARFRGGEILVAPLVPVAPESPAPDEPKAPDVDARVPAEAPDADTAPAPAPADAPHDKE